MKILLVLLLSLVMRSVLNADGTAPAAGPTAPPSLEHIQSRIARVTGLEASFSIDTIERVSLKELNIPCLSPQIADKWGVRVRFAPGKMKWTPPMRGVEDPYVRYFTVYLDADANRVLAITSRLAKRSPDIHDNPPPERTTVLLYQSSHEVYESFPADDPKFTFMEALDAVRAKGVGYPPLAQEIDGFYVMDSRLDRPAQPVWVINLRGLPPSPALSIPASPGGKVTEYKDPPIWQNNHLRNVVDAVTGAWLFGTNSPGPEE
jgi:hypothetical protein